MTKIEILDKNLGDKLEKVTPDVYFLILKAMDEYSKEKYKKTEGLTQKEHLRINLSVLAIIIIAVTVFIIINYRY